MQRPRSTLASKPACPDLTLASVFAIRDLDTLAAIYAGECDGFIYARDGHPNSQRLAERLARLDGAESAQVFPSGMAAIAALALDRLTAGDRVLISDELYGKTAGFFAEKLARFGIEVDSVDVANRDEVVSALARRPRFFWVESLSNPLLRAARIEKLAAMCAHARVALAVDATFTPPPMLRPIEYGASFVMHSITKILSGHADVTLGSLAGPNQAIASLRDTASYFGFHAAAFDCWLTERGLATLELRYDRAAKNAIALAELLGGHPKVASVHFPGLREHPDHGWFKDHSNGFGYMASFELCGGQASVNRLFQELEIVRFCPSLGDVATTVSHPATTSHRYLSTERRSQMGIADGLVRVSLGIEPAEAILNDFKNALAAI